MMRTITTHKLKNKKYFYNPPLIIHQRLFLNNKNILSRRKNSFYATSYIPQTKNLKFTFFLEIIIFKKQVVIFHSPLLT